jgi:hypothetical protein
MVVRAHEPFQGFNFFKNVQGKNKAFDSTGDCVYTLQYIILGHIQVTC